MSVWRAIRSGSARGFTEGIRDGLADLRSRLFIAGLLLGSCAVMSAVLIVGDEIKRGNMLAACIACGVVGVLLFSLPSETREGE